VFDLFPHPVQRVSGAPQMRGRGYSILKKENRGPGSAQQHFVLRRARDTHQIDALRFLG
jgi:hypothetical protein